MNLSDGNRKSLLEEMKFAVGKMDESKDALGKLYYFSAIFNKLHRIYNEEYDSDLVVVYSILSNVHKEFVGRISAIKQASDTAVLISDSQFEKLSELSKELGKKLKAKEDIFDTLKKFAILGYSCSGNGFYLMQKGFLKF